MELYKVEKTTKSLQTTMTVDNKISPLNPGFTARIQQYSKNRVFEPFEGQTGFETLQKANRTISQGSEKLKELGKRIQSSKITTSSIDKLDQLFKSAKLFNNIEKMTELFKSGSSDKINEFEEKFKESIYAFLKKGLELTLKDDYEPWVTQNASKLLKRRIYSLEDIQKLENDEREVLISELYPYSSHRYKGLISSFDKTFNVLLGIIVASNLPGTGVIVSLITMAKTIVRLSNRINSMSVLYGHPVRNLNQLYKVCSLLLSSIEDWEQNEQHVPLEPGILSNLYSEINNDIEAELTELLEVVSTKEMYIAIPGVGMLSLSKINLDDYKIDLMVQNLVSDYFFKEANESLNAFEPAVSAYIGIYRAFKEAKFLTKLRQKLDASESKSKKEFLLSRLKSLAGEDPEFHQLISHLNLLARQVYSEMTDIPEDRRNQFIAQRVTALNREFQ